MSTLFRLFRRAWGLLLVLTLIFSLTGPGLMTDASAVTQAEIAALKDTATTLSAQRKDLQAQLAAVQADKNAAMRKKELLEQQISLLQQEIDNITAQIAMYDRLIQEKTAELEQAEVEEAAQFELFCQRMRFMEEQGETSYWAILFSSSSFPELLDNYMIIEEIIQYDNQVIDNLAALQEKVTADRTELEAAQSEQEEAKVQQLDAQTELKAQEAEVDKLIAEISAQEDQLQSMEAALNKAAKELDAQIKAKEREYAAQIANLGPSESGFLWPLPAGRNVLSSLYGPRPHPVTHKPNNHTGIDVPAPAGTSIYASKSGVVTTSTYNGSYGNYVVVSHSDHTSTLYAHMSRRHVSEGQTVKQGDVVGYVGTTGSSTGNHLHFEVRIKGARVDPLDYFTDKALYARDNGVTLPLWNWMN